MNAFNGIAPGGLPTPIAARSVAVAIPVRNESACIIDCLAGFARQSVLDGPQRGDPFTVVLLLNNCIDDTAWIVGRVADAMPFRLIVEACALPPDQANAGTARRLAMEAAEAVAGPHGVLLTTDADAIVPPSWIADNLAAIEAGADAVAGRADMDPKDAAALPRKLHDDEARVQLLGALLDEITWYLDPDPADPWPRHTEHSGASIAVRVEAFRRAGGIPAVSLGEDREFFSALRRIDARIRHAPGIVVTVSGRIQGRAQGGMADTIKRRLVVPDQWLDDSLERTADHARRIVLRARARELWGRAAPPAAVTLLGRALDVSGKVIGRALAAPSFGEAWHMLEIASTALVRPRVPICELEAEIVRATELLEGLGRSQSAEAKAG